MQKIFVILTKMLCRVRHYILKPIDWLFCYYVLYSSGVKFSTFKCSGIPKIYITLGGRCIIGSNFKINNRESSNPIGRFNSCSIVVEKKGVIQIGNNVGMSSTAIVCHERIEIGDNVNFGGNVAIYDTDFHSLNPQDRLIRSLDVAGTKTKPIKIGNNVFIGAHTTILKGVSIGDNAIVGACSVVTKNIPANEIWAGNPAKFIRL
ncbi:transferase [Flavobacterium sp. AED]|nr:transferase [Flavobacterium sp. AED]